MFSLYLVLKFIHVMAAITAVGANVTYAIWIVRARSDPEHAGFALRGIKFIDDRIANPAYGVLLVSGLIMLAAGHIALTTLWVLAALVLFAILVVIGVGFYSPTLRDQIKLLGDGAGDAASAAFTRLGRRGQVLGQAMGLVVVVIVVLMVFKPTL